MPFAQPSSPDELLGMLQVSWNRHDMKSYSAHFAADAAYVNAVGAEWRGQVEIERNHLRMHERIFRDCTITRMTNRIQVVAPGVAVAVSDWEMTGTNPPPGWPMRHPREGILTLVLVQREGRWWIVAGQNTEKVPLPGE